MEPVDITHTNRPMTGSASNSEMNDLGMSPENMKIQLCSIRKDNNAAIKMVFIIMNEVPTTKAFVDK